MKKLNEIQTKNIKYSLLIFIMVLLASFSIMYANYQNIFLVESIRIQGNEELSENSIIQLSGIKKGMNIFDIDIVEQTKLLIDDPYIWNSRLSKIFPNQIYIEVYEREPVAFIELDKIYALDKFGTILPLPQKQTRFPILSGIGSAKNLSYGTKTRHPRIRQGIQLINAIDLYYGQIRNLISELHWSDEDESWILIFNAKKPLIYCGSDNLTKRLKILNTYIETLENAPNEIYKLNYVDLRYKDQVITK